jgi:hypothetical protein
VDGTAVVASVELIVGLAVLRAQEGLLGVDCHLHNGYGCCFDDFDFFEGGVVAEQGFDELESHPHPLSFRDVLKRGKDLLVDCDVDVTVFDCDAVGTAPEQFDREGVVAEKELDAFKGNNPPLVVEVGLFGDLVRHLFKLKF